ncbi:DNA adenine methylase [Varunaivibrio sulfuroxidans]|uniref:site-specific DNA-methyltransferase (adenine-specific) n=1 Tax=Varunaivibrio sulfuroxidans TaxID=1773489 RepID=A0A4R3JD29_9PROT|nr:DNA adenine methylase [Varunaivibrio sulfuroxidans]TCS62600.1 DNA adenine methylase [Varunaivibrio sulfuroxidans]WES30731.1 DNA adenine methylase [Varunaivibrio sulfuroxidans]
MESIKPILPIAPYIGGKRNLAKTIVPMIDAMAHATYAEVFGGMLGIFLRREIQPKAEVINDASKDVANLFRVLQRHYPQFIQTLQFQVTSRADFQRLMAANPDTLTDLERAARFLYLQRTGFGGKVTGRVFGVQVNGPARFNLSKLEPMLADLHERLAGTVIECLDFREFIPRYDRKTTLFYLDPPYWDCEGDYGKALFKREDFTDLAAILRGLKGRFILSLNDVPEVRELFSWATIKAVETTYSVGGGNKTKKAGEVIITTKKD